ncbi:MAG TPA: carboxymuconolactone decarboxylase family protein [Stellaceae bacterium]|nr:carboxymuconolactone decarboxylase family protein [Stellaceae bacterium]
MARVKYVDIAQGALNIRRALANSTGAGPAHTALAMAIRNKCRLDPRLREMAILQVGYAARCAYEWVHHCEIAQEFGVSAADIKALADDDAGKTTTLDPLTRAVLRAAREMTKDCAISDPTFAQLKERLSDEEIVDLVIAVGVYNSTVRVLESLKVDLEPECRHFLEAFPLPPR